jgi:hypothetical protein
VQEICISKGSFVNHKTSQHGAFAHLPCSPWPIKVIQNLYCFLNMPCLLDSLSNTTITLMTTDNNLAPNHLSLAVYNPLLLSFIAQA